MITCKSGITIRMPVQGISELGRATQGVKLIRLDEGDGIAAITQLDEESTIEEIKEGEGPVLDICRRKQVQNNVIRKLQIKNLMKRMLLSLLLVRSLFRIVCPVRR